MIVIFNDIVGITRSERESMRMTDRMEAVFFQYGETEIDYLKRKDKRLGEVIDKVGHIYRQADTDLFSSVVHHIVGQQISTKAQESIWLSLIHIFISKISRADANSSSCIKRSYGLVSIGSTVKTASC